MPNKSKHKKQMQQEIIIRPSGSVPGGTAVLTGSVQVGSDTFVITNRGRVIKNGADKMAEGEQMATYYLDANNPQVKILFDDEKDKLKKEVVATWMKHPNIQVTGGSNEHLKRAHFVLENLRTKKRDGALNIKRKGLVYNMVNNMLTSQMRDVAYAFNLNKTKELSPIELFINLVDFQNGLLMQPQNIDKFIDSEPHKMEVFVIAKKAIALGIVELRDGYYFNAGQQLGPKFEDVFQFCQSDVTTYETFIKPRVIEADATEGDDWKMPVKDMITSYYSETPVVKKFAGKEKDKKDPIKALREKAKELGVEGFQVKDEKQLKLEIADIENSKTLEQ